MFYVVGRVFRGKTGLSFRFDWWTHDGVFAQQIAEHLTEDGWRQDESKKCYMVTKLSYIDGLGMMMYSFFVGRPDLKLESVFRDIGAAHYECRDKSWFATGCQFCPYNDVCVSPKNPNA